MNNKTLIIIAIAIVVLLLLMKSRNNTTTSNTTDNNPQGGNLNNNNTVSYTSTGNTNTSYTSTGITQTTTSTSTTTQYNENLAEKYAIMVDDFLNTQNGCLPVYYWEYADLAKVPQNEWQYVKDAFRTYGKNFAQMYHKILNVSSKPCKTGFYKKEFDSIFDALAKRATW